MDWKLEKLSDDELGDLEEKIENFVANIGDKTLEWAETLRSVISAEFDRRERREIEKAESVFQATLQESKRTAKYTLKQIIGLEYYTRYPGNARIIMPQDMPIAPDTPAMVLLADQPIPDGWNYDMQARDIREWLKSWDYMERDAAIEKCAEYIAELME